MAVSAATAATVTERVRSVRLDRRAIGAAAIVVAAAGLALGLVLAATRPLTVDEAAIVGSLDGGFQRSLEESLEHAPGQTAYRALLYPLAAADAPDWALRLPSLLAVAAAAILVLLAGRMLAGRLAGTVAAALVAVGAVASSVSHEARPHAVALLGVCLATTLFVLAMTRRTTVPWVGWALVAALIPLVHPACAAVVVAQLAALAVGRQGQPRVAVSAGLTVTAVAGLLLAAAAVERSRSPADRGAAADALGTAVANAAAWSPVALGAAVAGVVVLVRRRQHWQATLVAGLAAGPPLAVAVGSLGFAVHPGRVAALALPGIALGAGIAVSALRDLRLAAAVLAVAAAASLGVAVVEGVRGPAADWPAAARWIGEQAARDETVVVVPPRASAAYLRYADGTRLHAAGRGDGVWVVLRTPTTEAVATARTVVSTPRYALLEERTFGDDLVVEHWVRP